MAEKGLEAVAFPTLSDAQIAWIKVSSSGMKTVSKKS